MCFQIHSSTDAIRQATEQVSKQKTLLQAASTARRRGLKNVGGARRCNFQTEEITDAQNFDFALKLFKYKVWMTYF